MEHCADVPFLDLLAVPRLCKTLTKGRAAEQSVKALYCFCNFSVILK